MAVRRTVSASFPVLTDAIDTTHLVCTEVFPRQQTAMGMTPLVPGTILHRGGTSYMRWLVLGDCIGHKHADWRNRVMMLGLVTGNERVHCNAPEAIGTDIHIDVLEFAHE